MAYSNNDAGRDRQSSRAAIFVDYENLYLTLNDTSALRGDPDELISEMIEALQKSLRQERDVRTAVSRAYADFTAFASHGETIQRLYLQGVEPRFVPCSLQSNAVEIQLTVDAMDLLHHRPDVEMFVLLTGRRTYLPLVQHVKQYGRGVLVAALEEPAAFDHVQHMDGEWFFDARDLLSSAARQQIASRSQHNGNGIESRRQPAEHLLIEDPVLIRAVELIERHFGQYEEVYLTPLLRKMSELLDEDRADPKSIISDLEDCGAVRLEKRQGFPHDYTVLIVDQAHPDVANARSAAKSHIELEEPDDDYVDGSSDDDEYYYAEADEYDDLDNEYEDRTELREESNSLERDHENGRQQARPFI